MSSFINIIVFVAIFSVFCNSVTSGLQLSIPFQQVSGQSNGQDKKMTRNSSPDLSNGITSNTDDRTQLALETAKKLREVRGEKIPNQYIVVLKDVVTSNKDLRQLANQSRNQGATVRHIYENAIKGFAIRIPDELALEAILKNPRVDYVQPDLKVKAFSQSLPTGVDRVDGDTSLAKSGDGSGSVNVDIAILDTGIDLNHPDLNVYKQTSFVAGTSSGNDDEGHGTSVAGITAAKDDSQGVVGMAPGARLWSVKVLDKNGQGFDSDIIAGIDYVTKNAGEIDVVNLSFGGVGQDSALQTAIHNSVAAGVTYVAAAGNEHKDASSTIPASYSEVIAVSAIVDTDGKCGGLSSISTSAGKDDTFASFSNYGSVVDIAAPGVLVKTTGKGSGYTTFSGTSASAPHVTGAAALYKAYHSSASPTEVRNALLDSGSKQSTVCDGKGHGYFKGDPDGKPEPLLYVGSAGSVDTQAPSQVAGLSVSTISDSQLNLAWTQNNEPDLDHYNIYRSSSSGFTATPGTTPPSGTSNTNSYVNTGLKPSSTYYYRVAAVDKSGNIGSLSVEKSGTTAAPPPDTTPPAQVTGLAITTKSTTQLVLAWTQNSEGDLDHYNIYKGTSPNFAVTLGSTIPVATSSTNSYQSAGLEPSTTYYYKVAAVDDSGNIGKISSEKSGTTASSTVNTPIDKTAPSKVKGLSVKSVSNSELKLKWTAVKASDLDHYNIYIGSKSKFSVTPGTTPPAGTSTTNSYSSTGLHSSTKYYFKVAAVDKAGNIGKLSSAKGGKTKSVSSSGIKNDEVMNSLKANSALKTLPEEKIDKSFVDINSSSGVKKEMNNLTNSSKN